MEPEKSLDQNSGGDAKKTKIADANANADVAIDEDLKFYLSGLFNIETSPIFKNLEQLKGKKEVTIEK